MGEKFGKSGEKCDRKMEQWGKLVGAEKVNILGNNSENFKKKSENWGKKM